MSDQNPTPPRNRGVYILPNLATTAALFAGFYSIIMGVNQNYEHAAIAMFVAMVLDGADGRIARMTNTQSDFGAEYDSLSDVVSFGLAPALVVHQWALVPLGKLGWVAAFFYAAATALRLARFNTQLGVADKRYFQGLPCPAAAGVVAGFLWVGVEHELDIDSINLIALGILAAAGALMVSNVRYNSFKEFDLKGRVPFFFTLVVLLGFALVSLDPPIVLFAVFFGYAVSGPLMTLIQIRARRAERAADPQRGRSRDPD